MSGAIIVEGDFADVPEITAAKERVMLMSQVVFDAFGMIENFSTLFPRRRRASSRVNGQRRPTIEMRPGEVQRWRLVGSQYQDDMLFELEKHDLNVIAYDGIALRNMQSLKQLLFAPGQRADILVQAGAPGTYEFRALPYDQGHPSPVGPVARVVVSGEPMPMKLPARLPKPPLEDDQGQRAHRRSHASCSRRPRRKPMPPATGRNSSSSSTARASIRTASTSG